MNFRDNTRVVNVGGVLIGGGNRIPVQSMCNTDTRDAVKTIEQIKRLEDAGCEIIRVAVPDEEAAIACEKIRKGINIPLVADIHFDYKLALMCVDSGCDKIRINPGNIGSIEKTQAVVDKCKRNGIPIRIGVNSGSLEKKLIEKYGGPTADALVESAMSHVKILEDLGFYDIVISIKASSVNTTIESYNKISNVCKYPLHVGVTEAGTVWAGTIKSAVGIGSILSNGIGDTIRVSLTGDPVEEVRVGRKILQSLELGGQKMFEFTSCPTCGRTCVDLIGVATEVENRLNAMEARGDIKKKFHVAIMGCAVNGPGEAKNADIGLAGGKNEFLIFEKGEILYKISQENACDEFIKIIRSKFC